MYILRQINPFSMVRGLAQAVSQCERILFNPFQKPYIRTLFWGIEFGMGCEIYFTCIE